MLTIQIPEDTMNYQEIIDKLPDDARVSCTFGYPGEENYTEYYRTPQGERYVVTKISRVWELASRWSIERLEP